MAAHEMAYKHGLNDFWPTPAMFKNVFPWLKEVDSLALANAQADLSSAYSSFFQKKAGHPKFKSKHFSRKAFKTNNQDNTIHLDERIVNGAPNRRTALLHLPKGVSVKLRYHRPIPEGAVIKNCTVSLESNGKWYVSILVEMPDSSPKTKEKKDISKLNVLGLDYKSD
jgi:putative transposase